MRDDKVNFYEEEINELREGLTAFPDDIFIKEQSWLTNYLMPLISIDLGLLRDDLAGTIIHIVNPTEPLEGIIGRETTDFHNDFCAENWIAFQLSEDNKFRFLGSEDYFLSASRHEDKVDVEFATHIKTIKESYQNAKNKYKLKGQLLPWQDDNPQGFLNRLGGKIWYSNWTNTAAIPKAFEMTVDDSSDDFPTDGVSIFYKGKEFMYVAEVSGYSYCGDGADAVLLFYEPESRIALFTFDWT